MLKIQGKFFWQSGWNGLSNRKVIKYLTKIINLGAKNGPAGWNGLIKLQIGERV